MNTNTMPSPEENRVPTVDTTSTSRVIQPQSSCLLPRHPVFPEPSRAALGDFHRGSALCSPPSPAFASTITPSTDSLTAPPTSSHLPVSSPPSTAPSDETISKYFRTKVPKTKRCANRVTSLVEAAKGFWDAACLHKNASKDAILAGIDTKFMYSIHIAHQVALRLSDQKLRQGIGALTPALETTATELSLKRPKVTTANKEGTRYIELILLGGPGSLLLTGRRVRRVWERRLQRGDVKLLLDYRDKHMPHHYARAVELNAVASRFIIKYMVANGSGYEVLASTQSELMCCLRSHVDLEQLAREDHRASEETSEELALMELLLDAAEERDITEFMKPFQEDDQLNTWTRGPFPTITQPAMESFSQNFNTLPDIPVPTQGSPSHCLAGVDSRNWVDNQINVIASGNIHGHNWLQQCEDTLPLGWCLEANGPFEAQNSPGPEEPSRMK